MVKNLDAVLLLLEVAFVLLALAGVAMVHVPTALVLAGVLGVIAVERAQSGRQARSAEGKEQR